MMKIKITISVLFLFILSGCFSPQYLPTTKNIDVNVYGSYIKVKTIKERVYGELIAVDETQIIILENSTEYSTGKCKIIPLDSIYNFRLKYAKPKKVYVAPLILLPVNFAIHGFYSLFTIPLQTIVSASVLISNENAFQYNKNEITITELKMFARYPYGLPENISLEDIK
ncbi:MAG: hypothetical protein KF882_03495 [Bacteroidia bacterium]|nr:hypothetical protein [Bacteroidia bacterium]MCO5254142.1 hypothetical protein [Bacteroidota bacterium]